MPGVPILARSPRPSRKQYVAALLMVWACSSTDNEPATPGHAWPYAVVMADCAPWDGAALSVTLAQTGPSSGQPGYPLLHIGVYHSPTEVLGHAFSFDLADTREGGMSFCRTDSTCISGKSVKVRFDQVAPDSTVDGAYQLVFPDGQRESGSFHARFLTQPALCG